jgi:hypothetical protein
MTKAASAGREPTVPGSWDRPGQSSVPERPDAPETPGQLLRESRRDADGAEPADRLATGDPPPRWSRADLQQRLERLPPGHPSSPEWEEPEPQLSSRAADTRRDDQLDTKPYDEPDAPKRDYWSETPAFLRAVEHHLRRWPQDQVKAAVDRSNDPPGSWRGDGNQYLDPAQHMRAKEVIAQVHRGEEKLTKHMSGEDQDPSCAAWLVGLEHRLKGEDGIKGKIARLLETDAPDATSDEISNSISDAIRYTFCVETRNYSAVYWDLKDRLEARGLEMLYSQNHWESSQYRGINTRWASPDGQRFEVQFHTPESFYAKEQLTHWAYERLRNPLTQGEERDALIAFQQEVSTSIPVPNEVMNIPDYRKDGR